MVDDLLLEHRRLQAGERHLVRAIEVEHLALLARELTGLGNDRLADFLLGSPATRQPRQRGLSTRPRRTRTFGDLMILRACLLFGRVFIDENVLPAFSSSFCRLLPDLIELTLDQLFRQIERVDRIELVEQLALDLGADHAGVATFDLRCGWRPSASQPNRLPTFLANSSSRTISPGASTFFTVTAILSPALPARLAA